MSFCKIKPDSKLYDEIFAHLNHRKNSIFLYYFFITPQFLQEYSSKITLDKNGEPTFESILPFINSNNAASNEAKIKNLQTNLNKDLDLLPINEIVSKAVKFNQTNKDYVAKVVDFSGQSSAIVVTELDENSTKFKADLEKALKTFEAIDRHLTSLGTPIKLLNSNIMQFEDALLKPEMLGESVDNLYGVVNLANNIKGFNALSEEYAHFVLENLREDPIIMRLESMITEEVAREVLQDEYERVTNYYQLRGREDLIAKEVLGRIYSNVISNNINQTFLPSNLFLRGLNKIINFIEKLFGKTSMQQVHSIVSNISNELGTYNKTKTPHKFIGTKELQQFKMFGEELAHTAERVDKLTSTFNTVITNLGKHVMLFKDKERESALNLREDALFEKIVEASSKNQTIEGLLLYVKESVDLMKHAEQNLRDIQKVLMTSTEPSKKVVVTNAHRLREIQSYLDSYKDPIKQVISLCNGLITKRDTLPNGLTISNELLSEIYIEATNVNSLLNSLDDSTKILGKQSLYYFYKEFFEAEGKDSITDPNGNVITLMDILEETKGDINLITRWVQSASNADDNLIKLADRTIQDKQQEIRQRAQEITTQIIELDQKFKLDGGGSTDFIYEKNAEGLPTGFLLSNVDYAKYYKDRENFIKTNAEYNKPDLPETEKAKLLKFWEEDHQDNLKQSIEVEINGKMRKKVRDFKIPYPKLYSSNALDKLTPAQRAYYTEYMKLKNELDFLLPPSKVHPYMAVQKLIEDTQEAILNDKLKNGSATKNAMQTLFNNFKINVNDEAQYAFKQVLTNFDKSIHNQIPIYYNHLVEDKKMLSMDASSSLADYAVMAINYAGMHEVVDIMEITKDIAKIRKFKRVSNKKSLVDKFTFKGKEFETDAEGQSAMTNIVARLDEVIETQVYGISRVEGTKFLGMDTNKALDTLIKYTSWSMLGYNTFTGINNVIVGKVQAFVEGSGQNSFTWKEWLEGDAYYATQIPKMMSEIGTTKNTTKIGLIGDYFNVGLKWKERIKEKKFYANSVQNTLNQFNASFMMTAGEHHMQMSTALAILKHTKVRAANGTEITLFDALDVVTTEHNGTVISGRLEVIPGTTNLDGSEITKKQLRDISLQIGKVNQSMHGIYNVEDAMGAKRYAIGRALTMYRNFIIPTMNKRFIGMTGKLPYDFYTHTFSQGYYTTAYNAAKDIFLNLKNNKENPFDVLTKITDESSEINKQFRRTQEANLKKFATEILSLIALTIAIFLLFSGDDDEEDKTWWNRSAYYFLKRLQLEMMFYVSPFSTGETILVSPTPILAPIKKTWALFSSIFTGYHVLETGPYKGHTELHRDFMKWLPIYNNVYDFFHLNEDDKRFKIFEK